MLFIKKMICFCVGLWCLTVPVAMAAETGLNSVGPQPKPSIYERPYSTTENIVDRKMLTRNTVALFGTGVATMGFLYMMPSSFTNWEDDGKSPFKKWWDNVSREPVWDSDDLFLNYVTHPYAGAIYYMGARSAGVNAVGSFWYSFALSTFFWEYGIESFAERPSIQDLIVTPVAGAVLGEWFYISKRNIIENGYELCGSKGLGKAAIWAMDPMTEAANLIWGDEKPLNNTLAVSSQPFVTQRGHLGYGLSLGFQF